MFPNPHPSSRGLYPRRQIRKTLLLFSPSWSLGPKPVVRNDVFTIRPKYYDKAEIWRAEFKINLKINPPPTNKINNLFFTSLSKARIQGVNFINRNNPQGIYRIEITEPYPQSNGWQNQARQRSCPLILTVTDITLVYYLVVW